MPAMPFMFHLAMGCLGLLLVFWSGARMCRLAYGETNRLVLATAGSSTGIFTLLLWCALLVPWVGLGPSILGYCLACVIGLVKWPPAPALEAPQLRRWEWLFVALGFLLMVGYALMLLTSRLVAEGDFFLHAANVGLILEGHYPPINFNGEVLRGHHGRDFLVSITAALSGLQALTADWLVVVVAHGLSFLVVFAWLRKETGSPLQTALGTGFLFFGANFAGYTGMLDLLTGNQSVANLSFLLSGFHVMRVLQTGRGGWLAGAIVGIGALVYEMYFGLVVLATLMLAAALALQGKLPATAARATAAMLVTAALLAAVEGGPITHLVRGKLGLEQASTLTDEEVSTDQTFSLEFPKTRLFQVRCNNLRPSRPFETKFRPWSTDFTHSTDYAFIWSQKIVDLFWYPVWLAPVTMMWLLVGRSPTGIWFASHGALGFLIPSLVGFGFYEQETGRWLAIAAFGWSAAFGLMVGAAVESGRGKWRVLAVLFAAWAIWFGTASLRLELEDFAAAYKAPGTPMRDSSPGVMPVGPPWPDAQVATHYHFGLAPAAWDAGERLRQLSDKDDRFLANFREDEPVWPRPDIIAGGQLNVLGVATGIAGMVPGGLTSVAGPVTSPLWSTSAQARSFWTTGEGARLLPLDVQWVWVQEENAHPEVLERLAADPSLETVYRENGQWLLRFHPDKVSDQPGPCPDLELSSGDGHARPGPLRPFTVRIAPPDEDCLVNVRFLHQETGLYANSKDLLVVPVRRGEPGLSLWAPYVPGEYLIEYSPQGNDTWRPLTTVTVEP